MANLLLVDDDPAVLHVTSRLLANAGHSVLLAVGGLAGTELFEQHEERIHAVFLDVVMPELDGVTAFHLIRHRRPDVPVVFLTGNAELVPETVRNEPGVALLTKPFHGDELAATVAQVLGSDGGLAVEPPGAAPGWRQLDLPDTTLELPPEGP